MEWKIKKVSIGYELDGYGLRIIFDEYRKEGDKYLLFFDRQYIASVCFDLEKMIKEE